MHMRFRKGQMPRGGTYEDFAALLAKLRRTFEPLKDRDGRDGQAFASIAAALDRFAARHGVITPQELLAEQAEAEGCATPFEVRTLLSAIVIDFGLCHPQDGPDDDCRKALEHAFADILQRRGAMPDTTPMQEILAMPDQDRSPT